ncbi:MAG: aminotransferase class V-fold PLP-dependent enzyme, partial [Campylobacterota bacterium]|nr:aminotransferase class V-fold PLP-dependent enzyme [Campylobacterota bacterium]
MEVYLDNNSTTQMDPKVQEVYCDSVKKFGNINVIYNKGIEARALLNDAYDKLYDGINAADEDDIIITSSTTEGNNIVLKTFLDKFLRGDEKNHIISTVAEHSSIKAPLKYCKEMGMDVTYIGTDANGLVKLDELEAAITPKTCLVSVLTASNETGAIQDIKAISAICKKHDVFFHSDGAQAIGKMKVDVQDLGVDYFSFSAHKFHGPKGVGALYVKGGVPYSTQMHGAKNVMGGKRGGSLYNNGVAAMATAVEIANINLSFLDHTTKALRDKLEDAFLAIPDTKSYVPREHRLDNLVAISFKGIEGEAMLWDMNEHGIYLSTGSSCSSEDLEGSAVVEALGEKTEIANATVMFALSKFTTEEEINYVIEKVKATVERLREISMTYAKQEAF